VTGVLVTRGRERTLNGEFSQTARGQVGQGGVKAKKEGENSASANTPTRDGKSREDRQYFENIKD
jgi:hypothetical protein